MTILGPTPLSYPTGLSTRNEAIHGCILSEEKTRIDSISGTPQTSQYKMKTMRFCLDFDHFLPVKSKAKSHSFHFVSARL